MTFQLCYMLWHHLAWKITQYVYESILGTAFFPSSWSPWMSGCTGPIPDTLSKYIAYQFCWILICTHTKCGSACQMFWLICRSETYFFFEEKTHFKCLLTNQLLNYQICVMLVQVGISETLCYIALNILRPLYYPCSPTYSLIILFLHVQEMFTQCTMHHNKV